MIISIRETGAIECTTMVTNERFKCKTHYQPKSENRVSAVIVLPRGGKFYTKSVMAQNALSAMLCRAEVSDLWQNALSGIRKTCTFSECT